MSEPDYLIYFPDISTYDVQKRVRMPAGKLNMPFSTWDTYGFDKLSSLENTPINPT